MKILLMILNLAFVAMYGIDVIVQKKRLDDYDVQMKKMDERMSVHVSTEEFIELMSENYAARKLSRRDIKSIIMLSALIAFFFLIQAIDVAFRYGE